MVSSNAQAQSLPTGQRQGTKSENMTLGSRLECLKPFQRMRAANPGGSRDHDKSEICKVAQDGYLLLHLSPAKLGVIH